MKKVLFILLLLSCLLPLQAQRIYVEGNRLMVGNGNPIFINGANTPWDNWNDFGGSYDHSFWDGEFQRMKNAGGNATRIWITCSADGAVKADSTGFVTVSTQKFWTDLDDMFALAEQHQIYILATLISFDHTKNTYNNYQNWRNMYTSVTNVDSFVNNYAIPFTLRYKNNPYLFAIEPCNEIEWVNQDTSNAQFSWNTLQYFAARVIAAVHENSTVLTTVGSNMKWQTDTYPGNEGNQFSDARLKAQYNSPSVYLDFYSPHFYQWVIDWYGNPFASTNVSAYGLTDKPCIIGELPANGVGGTSITQCFVKAYSNGFQGLMPWTSNGVDTNGSLSTGLASALTNFKNSYPDLVYPETGTTPGPETGDVNNSGVVDIIDALMVAQYYVGLNPPGFFTEAADVNASGAIDIIDALMIAQYYVGLINGF